MTCEICNRPTEAPDLAGLHGRLACGNCREAEALATIVEHAQEAYRAAKVDLQTALGRVADIRERINAEAALENATAGAQGDSLQDVEALAYWEQAAAEAREAQGYARRDLRDALLNLASRVENS